jgi:orotate phosphoribosyltransferase
MNKGTPNHRNRRNAAPGRLRYCIGDRGNSAAFMRKSAFYPIIPHGKGKSTCRFNREVDNMQVGTYNFRGCWIQIDAMNTSVDSLIDLAKKTGAIRFGEFTLASGAQSNRYFEGKLLTLHPEGARRVGEAICDILEGSGAQAVGGLILGSIPIATAVAVISYGRGKPILAFLVREAPKEHGTKKQIEGHLEPGMRVAIVDDVVTRGGSVFKAIEAVEKIGCKVVKVVTIVDRHEGGGDRLIADGYDFVPLIHFNTDGTVQANNLL